MNFDPNALLLSLVVGSIGFVAFVYGKKQSRLPPMAAGAVLMVYPYFVTNLAASAAIGIAVLALWWLAVRLGA